MNCEARRPRLPILRRWYQGTDYQQASAKGISQMHHEHQYVLSYRTDSADLVDIRSTPHLRFPDRAFILRPKQVEPP